MKSARDRRLFGGLQTLKLKYFRRFVAESCQSRNKMNAINNKTIIVRIIFQLPELIIFLRLHVYVYFTELALCVAIRINNIPQLCNDNSHCGPSRKNGRLTS